MVQKIWSQEEIEILKREYPLNGSNIPQLNKTLTQIRSKATKLKITVNSDVLDNIKHDNGKNRLIDYNVKINKFINLDYRSAYVLGYLWADGYLVKNKVDLCILESDGNELINIFNTTGSWTIYHRYRKNRQPQIGFCTKNIPLGNLLNEYGFNDKSYIEPNFITNYSKDIQRLFWLGFFDGDGCLYSNWNNHCTQLTFAGTYEYEWALLSSFLDSINITYTIRKQVSDNGNKASYLRITNRSYITQLLDYLYRDHELGLSRKRNKYLELKTNIGSQFAQ